MGNNSTHIFPEDYINQKFKNTERTLVPNCGRLSVIEFERDTSLVFVQKILNQTKYDNIYFDPKKLQVRLKDTTVNQADLLTAWSKNYFKYFL